MKAILFEKCKKKIFKNEYFLCMDIFFTEGNACSDFTKIVEDQRVLANVS